VTRLWRHLATVELSRIGFEIELLAPAGRSRRTLADALAASEPGAEVRPTFHLDAEPSKVPGMGIFYHLTPAFEVRTEGGLLCRLVDDITIRDDLDPRQPAAPGWYRIVSDDRRLLRLVARHCKADTPIESCLEPMASLFDATVEQIHGFHRLDDEDAATVAIAAPLVGGRHRVCEIVTPPLVHDHAGRLDHVLVHARRLGFVLPAEAAVHLHFDAQPFRSARAVRNLVRLVAPRQDLLRYLVGTNPRCRRLGPLPPQLLGLVEQEDFLDGDWHDTQARLATVGLHKYLDVNLANLIRPPRGKDTVEFRILPSGLDAAAIVDHARLFQAIVDRALCPEPVEPVEAPVPPTQAAAFVADLRR
jgi:Putative amidoligase enzyme